MWVRYHWGTVDAALPASRVTKTGIFKTNSSHQSCNHVPTSIRSDSVSEQSVSTRRDERMFKFKLLSSRLSSFINSEGYRGCLATRFEEAASKIVSTLYSKKGICMMLCWSKTKAVFPWLLEFSRASSLDRSSVNFLQTKIYAILTHAVATHSESCVGWGSRYTGTDLNTMFPKSQLIWFFKSKLSNLEPAIVKPKYNKKFELLAGNYIVPLLSHTSRNLS